MNQNDVQQALDRAIGMFVAEDATILTRDVNERTLTHRLAVCLERGDAFAGWHVDCEYNRDGTGSKRLPVPQAIMSDDTKGRTIYPDIIVHKRIPFTECASEEEKRAVNLLVIEAKKDASTDEREADREKLRAIKESFLYQFAVFVNFRVDERANPRVEIDFI